MKCVILSHLEKDFAMC